MGDRFILRSAINSVVVMVYTNFHFTVDEGNAPLNPSCKEKMRRAPQEEVGQEKLVENIYKNLAGPRTIAAFALDRYRMPPLLYHVCLVFVSQP